VTDAPVFDVLLEFGLDLVADVRPCLPDTEWEALDGVVEEVDGIGLGVPAVDLESPDTGGVVDGDVLIAFDRLPVFSPENQKFEIDLDLVARHLSLVTGGVDLAEPCSPREQVQAIALEDMGYAGARDLDVVVARQVPDDTHGSQVVGLAQVENFLAVLRRRSVLGFFWIGFFRTRAASPCFSSATFQR